jgi:hypothetical protein
MEIVKNSLYSLQHGDTTDMGSLDGVLVSVQYTEPLHGGHFVMPPITK